MVAEATIGVRKPETPSPMADVQNYDEPFLITSRQEGQLPLPTVAGYEQPIHSANGRTSPHEYHSMPRKVRDPVVPIPKPREQRALSTGKRTIEPSLHEQHTHSNDKGAKAGPLDQHKSSTGKVTNPQAKPVHPVKPHTFRHNINRPTTRSARRKSNPPPVNAKPQLTVFATYSVAKDPSNQENRSRASTGGKPPISPKPKGTIISSYSMTTNDSPDNATTREECEYDIAISSVVVSNENERKEEYEVPHYYDKCSATDQ